MTKCNNHSDNKFPSSHGEDGNANALSFFRFCPHCGSANFIDNDFKSKRCRDCGFVYYLNASAATAAFILDDRGRLLAEHRKLEPSKGKLDLPGGFVDMGEAVEEGMKRGTGGDRTGGEGCQVSLQLSEQILVFRFHGAHRRYVLPLQCRRESVAASCRRRCRRCRLARYR